MTGGILRSLAHEALHIADCGPRDDPRIVVIRNAESAPRLRNIFKRYPIARMPRDVPAAPFDFRDGVLFFRDENDQRDWGQHVRLGFASVLCVVHGVQEELAPRVAGWLALDDHATLLDCETHPYAPPDFLRSELFLRRGHSISGVWPVRRWVG